MQIGEFLFKIENKGMAAVHAQKVGTHEDIILVLPPNQTRAFSGMTYDVYKLSATSNRFIVLVKTQNNPKGILKRFDIFSKNKNQYIGKFAKGTLYSL